MLISTTPAPGFNADAPMATRCAAAVGAVCLEPAADPSAWLTLAGRALCEAVRPPVRASVTVLGWHDERWLVRHALPPAASARGGRRSPRATGETPARWLLELGPPGERSFVAGCTGGPDGQRAAWADILEDPAPVRLIALVEPLSPRAGHDTGTPEAMGVIMPWLAQAYDRRFLDLERRRAALTRMLTPARRQALELFASGLSEAEVAAQTGRSRHTVHDHLRAIYRALKVHNRIELHTLWMNPCGTASDEPSPAKTAISSSARIAPAARSDRRR